tara:strand:+ start:2998 stop:3972 length:975 start_codon:yes stop_codon:yes gene_type:complete
MKQTTQNQNESQEDYKSLKDRGFQKINTSVSQSIAVIKDAMNGKRNVLKTKWPRLNRNLLGGLQQGKLYVVAGRPGVGKSAFSNQLIFDILDRNPLKKLVVLYWTFEMPGYQQIMRSAAKDVNKQIADLLSVDAQLSQGEFSDYTSKVQKYSNYEIYFNNHPKSMQFIKDTNESLFQERPDVTMVNLFDHSRLIAGTADTELQRLNTVSKGCMWMQSKMGTINILLSQLNRNIEQEHRAKDQYQPMLSDLFGGDSIGQDAHVVMMLQRPHDLYGITDTYCDEPPEGLLACHIEKNRDGLLGMIPFEAELSTFTITERKKTKIKN